MRPCPFPAALAVKELKRVELAPQGLEATAVRRLLRECDLRGDIRATSIFNLFPYKGARVSELVGLTLADLVVSERSGSVTFRDAKGGKQRTCPLPLPARRALQAWLDVRPPIATPRVLIGCRGALKEDAVPKLCDKYSAITGVRFHPHTLRHSTASRYLADNANDIVGLGTILGHESLNTTRRYSLKTAEALAEGGRGWRDKARIPLVASSPLNHKTVPGRLTITIKHEHSQRVGVYDEHTKSISI